MEEFWILILVAFFATNSLEKAESVKVKLEETPLKTFDEIFGEGWWDKGEAEDLKTLPTNFGQNVHHQIDRQNTQIGQIEPNSTDQLGQIEPNSTDQLGQIEPNSTDQLGQIQPNSTDQNSPLTESDHSDNGKNGEEQNEIIKESNEKRKIIDKFLSIKDEFKQKGKYSKKEWNQIEDTIAKHLKVNRSKIYQWKNKLGLIRKVLYGKKERKHLIEKFDQKKAELKRDGLKNFYHHEIDKAVAKELGLNFGTINRWKKELGQTRQTYSDDEKLKIVQKLMRIKSERSGEDKKSCKEIDKEIAERFGVNVGTIYQWKKAFGLSRKMHNFAKEKELIKRYFQIKDKNPKISDEKIAKMLKIGRATLVRWKFKQQQLHPNSVNGHYVEENAAANVQEIENSSS